MIDILHKLIGLLPFDWVEYGFMKNAFLAVLVVTPCFGLAGTMVVANRLSFFSDVIGHSSLAGIAIGMVLGLGDVRPAMIIFAVLLAVAMNIFIEVSGAANDTVLGIILAATTGLGVVMLSRAGSFNRYSDLIVGNILSVQPGEIFFLFILLLVVLVFWFLFGGYLAILSVDPALVYDRRVSPFVVRTMFTVLIAVLVILSIRWIGVLIINALFIIPAAAARLWSGSLRGYYAGSVLVSMASGISGLIISFYWGSAAGGAMVLCAVVIYVISIIMKAVLRKMPGA